MLTGARLSLVQSPDTSDISTYLDDLYLYITLTMSAIEVAESIMGQVNLTYKGYSIYLESPGKLESKEKAIRDMYVIMQGLFEQVSILNHTLVKHINKIDSSLTYLASKPQLLVGDDVSKMHAYVSLFHSAMMQYTIVLDSQQTLLPQMVRNIKSVLRQISALRSSSTAMMSRYISDGTLTPASRAEVMTDTPVVNPNTPTLGRQVRFQHHQQKRRVTFNLGSQNLGNGALTDSQGMGDGRFAVVVGDGSVFKEGVGGGGADEVEVIRYW